MWSTNVSILCTDMTHKPLPYLDQYINRVIGLRYTCCVVQKG